MSTTHLVTSWASSKVPTATEGLYASPSTRNPLLVNWCSCWGKSCGTARQEGRAAFRIGRHPLTKHEKDPPPALPSYALEGDVPDPSHSEVKRCQASQGLRSQTSNVRTRQTVRRRGLSGEKAGGKGRDLIHSCRGWPPSPALPS